MLKYIESQAKQFQDRETAILRDQENKAKKEKRG
jgi:hypothetical protein